MLFFIVFHFDIDKLEHMYYSYKRTYVLKGAGIGTLYSNSKICA